MGLSRLENLYRQVILDHSSQPHNFGTLAGMTNQIELNNPTCGDVIQLQLKIVDQVIVEAKFSGSGCSISTASASMMTDLIKGQSETEAENLSQLFSNLVQGKEVAEEKKLGDAALLKGVAKFPARIRCATLAWKALEKGLETEQETIIEQHLHSEDEGV